MQTLRELTRDFHLQSVDALTFEGLHEGVTLQVALTPRATPPQVYDLTLTFTPLSPHPSLFAVPKVNWLGTEDALRQTFDYTFDGRIALRCEPRVLALFDHEQRQSILALMTDQTCLVDTGRLLLLLPSDHPRLAELFTEALALARQLGTTDLTPGVARFLADPSPYVRDHFTQFAKTDPELSAIVAAVRADATLRSPDISHAALLAQVRDPALDLERRSTAFVEMLHRFPWSETVRVLPRIKVFFGSLTSVNRGAPFTTMLGESLPLWMSPDLDTEAAWLLLEAAWSLRPPLTPPLGVTFLRIMQRLARRETLPWVADLLGTRDIAQFDEALLALDILGATRLGIRKLMGPRHRELLIDRAPHFARTHRRGSAFLEVAASSLPPESHGHLHLFVQQLGELGDPESAPYLFTHIEHYDDGVREAVLFALGHCGTPDHIEYLEPQTSGLFRSSRIKQLARDAIAHIRESAGMKDAPGALSLADISPGGLSLPDSAKD